MELSYLQLTDKNVPYYLCKIKGSDLIRMSYVARRGQSEEEGAVQRILNTRRISSISRFLQNGGFFPTNIILNIIDANKIEVSENIFCVSDEEDIAQVLDGQHRIADIIIRYAEVLIEEEINALEAFSKNHFFSLSLSLGSHPTMQVNSGVDSLIDAFIKMQNSFIEV